MQEMICLNHADLLLFQLERFSVLETEKQFYQELLRVMNEDTHS